VKELIAKLEAAQEPTDELRLAVAQWCYDNGGIGGVTYDPALWLVRRKSPLDSLDAAVALVPEGWSWKMRFQPWARPAVGGQYSEQFAVSATPWDGEKLLSGRTVNGAGDTPATAFCIVALKAWSAK